MAENNNPLQKITETKYDNGIEPTDQRESVLIRKHISFSVEKFMLKVGTKLVSSYLFKPLFWTNAVKELKNVQMMYYNGCQAALL